MFRVSLQLVGRSWATACPSPPGPRHCGHSSSARTRQGESRPPRAIATSVITTPAHLHCVSNPSDLASPGNFVTTSTLFTGPSRVLVTELHAATRSDLTRLWPANHPPRCAVFSARHLLRSSWLGLRSVSRQRKRRPGPTRVPRLLIVRHQHRDMPLERRYPLERAGASWCFASLRTTHPQPPPSIMRECETSTRARSLRFPQALVPITLAGSQYRLRHGGRACSLARFGISITD
jgi:hypothetical protein